MRDPLGRPPVALMVPAVLAVLVLLVPLVAMVAETDLPGLWGQLRSEPLREALLALGGHLHGGDAGLPGARAPAGLAAGQGRLPRPRARSGPW